MSRKPGNPVALFRWLCAALSPRVDAQGLQALPYWPETESALAALVELAAHHMVLPGLYQALRGKELLLRFPADFGEALQGYFELNRLRNADLRQEMLSVTRMMNQIGVTPVWLKGATNLLAPDWQESPRMMLDLDFWVPDAQQHPLVMHCLSEAGYQVHPVYVGLDYSEHHHHLPVARAGEPAALEVHRHIVDAQFASLLPDAAALERVEWLNWQGLAIGQLSPQDKLMQSYLQCTAMNVRGMARGHIPLMKVLDCVERIQALGGEYPTDFLTRLDGATVAVQARQFLTFLRHEFHLPSPWPEDQWLRRKQALAIRHPQAVYAWFIVAHAYRVASSGQLGSPRTWWPKLLKHLRTLSGSSLPV